MKKKGNLWSTGFLALVATQFFGAFNDNTFKFIISLIAIESSRGSSGIAIVGFVFILPFLLFSMTAGFFADRFSKRSIILVTNLAEVLIMLLGGVAFYYNNFPFMLMVLFLMGAQSTFFSPAKYGIIPELLNSTELSKGNGIIHMWTFTGIILGTASGGIIMSVAGDDIFKTSYFIVFIATVGLLSGIYIKQVPPAGSTRRPRFDIHKELFENIHEIYQNKPLFFSTAAIVFFWFIGILFQMNITIYADNMLHMKRFGTGFILAIAAIGISIGSLIAGWLSGEKIELGLVPLGAILMSISSFALGFSYSNLTATILLLITLGISCGLFLIPLNAYIQETSPKDKLGKNLSTLNFLTFTGMLVSSGFLMFLLDVLKLNSARIFIFSSFLIMAAALFICIKVPGIFLRFIIWLLTHSLYKIKVVGKKNIPNKGAALIVCNHTSYVDALIINGVMQKLVRFILIKDIYTLPVLNPFFKLMHVIPVNPTGNPKELIATFKRARKELDAGHSVCIFAEGGITRTGNMLPFKAGFERILKGSNLPVIPVHIDGIWGSIFSFEGGKFIFKKPKRLFFPVTISFGTPMQSSSKTFQVRTKVQELGAEAFRYRKYNKLSLPVAFWMKAKKHPFRMAVADNTGNTLNFYKLLEQSHNLSRCFIKISCNQIGIIIHPSVNGCLINLALSTAGKVAVNLNINDTDKRLNTTIKLAGIKHIVSSKKHPCSDRIKNLKKDGELKIIWIEDLQKKSTIINRATLFLNTFILPTFLSRHILFKSVSTPKENAAVIFTRNATNPKGVLLSHSNIMSNIESIDQVFGLQKTDKIIGILPFFHSYGLTMTLWLPLVKGIGVIYHNSPTKTKEIENLIKNHEATVLLSTPGLLKIYTRKWTQKNCKTIRTVLVGSEKLDQKVAFDFKDKFGIDPMEGYGCAELSPAIAVGVEDYIHDENFQTGYKPGTIGHPLPGVAVKIVDPKSFKELDSGENGLLLVKGESMMKGYLNKPSTNYMKDGWFIPGDIANIDNDGFIILT